MQPASVRSRVFAAMITGNFFGCYIVIVGLLASKGTPEAILLLLLIPVFGYFGHGAYHRARIGMKFMNIFYASSLGDRISPMTCMLRMFLGLAMWPLAIASIALMNQDERRRSLEDLICGTAVWENSPGSEGGKTYAFEVIPLEERQS